MIKKTKLPQFSDDTLLVARIHCERLLKNVQGLTAVLLATADGFDVVSAVKSGLKPSRLAALASSISAIGQVVSLEGSLGHSKRVTIDGEFGFVLVSAIDRQDVSLVLILVSDNEALLGQLNVSASASAAFFKHLSLLPASSAPAAPTAPVKLMD
jgi:predicted regulator of Ras-like GTPase activity (Roadblock/LC7/MglB family)